MPHTSILSFLASPVGIPFAIAAVAFLSLTIWATIRGDRSKR